MAVRGFRPLLPALHAALGCMLGCFALLSGAQGLPPEPSYKGELMGDGKGGVIVRPFTAPEIPRENVEAKDNAPPGRGPRPERQAAPDRRLPATPQAMPEPQRDPVAGPLTLEVGPSRKIRTIAQAAKIARSGDTIVVEPGVYAGDVAVFTQDRLTIKASGGRARLNANGASAEGKAIWVMRGGHITVENFEFVGARVAAHNGAGIRFEKGRLVLRNCLFRDNENGILTASDKDAELEIENSEFDRNGTVEGYRWPRNELYLVNNTLVDGRASDGYFLRAAPGLQSLKAMNNLLVTGRSHDLAPFSADPKGTLRAPGKTVRLPDPGVRQAEDGTKADIRNNYLAASDEFVQPAQFDYRIRDRSSLAGKFQPPGTANGIDLTPRAYYAHPAQTRQLAAEPTLPGASQSVVR